MFPSIVSCEYFWIKLSFYIWSHVSIFSYDSVDSGIFSHCQFPPPYSMLNSSIVSGYNLIIFLLAIIFFNPKSIAGSHGIECQWMNVATWGRCWGTNSFTVIKSPFPGVPICQHWPKCTFPRPYHFSQRNFQSMKTLFSVVAWGFSNTWNNTIKQFSLIDRQHTCRMWVHTQKVSRATLLSRVTHTPRICDSASSSYVIVMRHLMAPLGKVIITTGTFCFLSSTVFLYLQRFHKLCLIL